MTTIALLGGESSGKSYLARDLHKHLRQVHGFKTRLVPEYLRAWCKTHGRVPHAHEQSAIAARQTQLIDQAAAGAGVQVVVADTTALVVAAYSELYFSDMSLYRQAQLAQATYPITLLMGLDLPWTADGPLRDGPAQREAADAALRRALNAVQLPFHTIYGHGDQRLRNALRAIGPHLAQRLGKPRAADTPSDGGTSMSAICANCGDPACERRLFSALL